MEKYEKVTQSLTDEELMELVGGFSNIGRSFYPVTVVAYGLVISAALKSIMGTGAGAAYKA